MTIADAVHDTFRVDYYKGYIKNLRDAITFDGVDVGAYFAWSMMDNFEWCDGYSVRFGMVYVDYKRDDKPRYLKDSLFWYSQFIKTHNINGVFNNPYHEYLLKPEEDSKTRKQTIKKISQ
jgi:beta-glucosidase